MAATRLIALHQNKGKSIGRSIKDRLDYAQNPDKTNDKEYVSSYECDPSTAWAEFLLSKNAYHQKCGREYRGDIIAYQIRQSFKPGEITPEEANQVGYETAIRFTKGKHAFTVSTHIDKAHIHNHVIFNAVSLNGEEKFRNFFLSGKALAKLSDMICFEHGLSIIEPGKKQQHEKNQKYDRKPEKDTAAYKKAITLYGEAAGNTISEEESIGKQKPFDFLIDIEKKMQEGKGAGYEKWAMHFNNKQAAEVLIFLQENNIHSYAELEEKTKAADDRFDGLSNTIRKLETQLKDLGEMKKTIITYAKTRDVYAAYRQSGYSKQFYEANRAEITLHQSAKQTFEQLKKAGKPVSKVKEISAEYDRILQQKLEAYREYKEAKTQMQIWETAKKNVGMLLQVDVEKEAVTEKQKRPERLRSHRDTR